MAAQTVVRTEGPASTRPIHPFLFALYPIARLYEENIYEVSLADVLGPLLAVLGLTAVGFATLTLLLREPRRAAIVTSTVVLQVMLFGLIHELTEPIAGDVRYALLVVGILIIIGAVWAVLRIGPRLGSVTLGLNVVSIVLVALAMVPAVQGAAATVNGPDGEDDLPGIAIETGAVPDRDIYHLILDRYGSQAALEAGFGIDNSEFIGWLRAHGFDVVDDAYANYTKTVLSLASTLGMELLDDVVADAGPDGVDLGPLQHRLAASRVGAFLQDQGYRYVHLGSWFGPSRVSEIADRSYFPTAEVSFASTLYDLSVLPMLLEGPDHVVDNNRRHADAAAYQFERLERLTRRTDNTYVLAHVLLPHPPYVFLEDGTYDPAAATFETQLADVNRRLRDFLMPLLERPEAERPIIVLQGDEGPYPERWDSDRGGFDWGAATDAELVTKFGILEAMYLPGEEGAAPLRQGLTAVNTYRELLRRYFAMDLADQPDRVMASNEGRPYDLVDVTARLEAGGVE